MANVEAFFLQPFKTHRKRLAPGECVLAKTKRHALNESLRFGRTAEGMVVIHVTADDETGEVSEFDVLEQHDPGGNRGGDPRAVIPIQREASWRIG